MASSSKTASLNLAMEKVASSMGGEISSRGEEPTYSNFDVTQEKQPKFLPTMSIDEDADWDGSGGSDEDDFDWGTSVVVARRVDRTDPSFAADGLGGDGDEWKEVPNFHSVGIIPDKPPELPVRRKPPRYAAARVIT